VVSPLLPACSAAHPGRCAAPPPPAARGILDADQGRRLGAGARAGNELGSRPDAEAAVIDTRSCGVRARWPDIVVDGDCRRGRNERRCVPGGSAADGRRAIGGDRSWLLLARSAVSALGGAAGRIPGESRHVSVPAPLRR
jgi:hypothetical protein